MSTDIEQKTQETENAESTEVVESVSATEEITETQSETEELAEEIKPEYCCFVPEKREELTTEGGLDVFSQSSKIKEASERLKDAGIRVSLFIDTDEKQIIAAADTLAPYIEIHTGHYADASNQKNTEKELENIKRSIVLAMNLGLKINAGHGLNYENTERIATMPEILELNIGHSIISRAVFSGLSAAVQEMKELIDTQYQLEKF